MMNKQRNRLAGWWATWYFSGLAGHIGILAG